MSAREALLVALGGLVAGGANAIAGGGSLLTFPLLVALGLPPLAANVTNTVGIAPAALGGMLGYRAELRNQGRRMVLMLPVCVAGAVGGAAVLLLAPAHIFSRLVPILIAVSCVALLFRRQLAGVLTRHHADRRRTLIVGLLFTGVYGGYFGAAVSVMVLAVLGITLADSLQRLNALKVPLAGVMNLVSGVAFAIFAPVNWGFVAVLAPSTFVGARCGAAFGRRIPERPLRWAVAVLGLVAALWLALSHT